MTFTEVLESGFLAGVTLTETKPVPLGWQDELWVETVELVSVPADSPERGPALPQATRTAEQTMRHMACRAIEATLLDPSEPR
jgi:hypothetical protein